MTKTFAEVVRDIKKNEVWESDKAEMYIKYNNSLCISFKNEIKDKCSGIIINLDDIFTLQRKEYDFTEAYKAYTKGKEIESLESGYRLKIINNENMYSSFDNTWKKNDNIQYNEINNKWYIND